MQSPLAHRPPDPSCLSWTSSRSSRRGNAVLEALQLSKSLPGRRNGVLPESKGSFFRLGRDLLAGKGASRRVPFEFCLVISDSYRISIPSAWRFPQGEPDL